MKSVHAIPFSLGLMGTALVAQGLPDSSAQNIELEQIGVKARQSKPAPSSPNAVAPSAEATAEVITQDQIAAIQPKDFYDLFARAAGAQTTYQGRKYMNFLSIRGGDGNSVGVIIDGYYVPAPQASRFLAQFPMDAVESVQIVRDSTSLTLGPIMDLGASNSSPNQGFVIITTRKGLQKETGVNLQYGSFGTREVQLSHSEQLGAFSFRAVGTTNGFDGRDGWHMEQKASSVLLNGSYATDSLRINSTLYYQRGMRNMEHSFTNTTNSAYWGYDPMTAWWGAFGIDKLWSRTQTTSFSYSHGYIGDTEVMGNDPKGVTNDPSKVVVTRTRQHDFADNGHLWHTAILGNHTLKFGLQGTWWYEPNGYASWDGKETKETLLGAYAQDVQQLLDRKLALDYGVRVDRKYIGKGVDANSFAIKQWTEPTYAGALGAAFKATQKLTLSARLGFSHAATDPFLRTVNNAQLDAENRIKYEAAVEAHLHPAFNPKLTAFFYDIHNGKIAVSTTGTKPNVVTVYGQADIQRKGFEFSSTGNLTWGFGYNANYSYVNISDATTSRTTPHRTGSMLLSYTQGPVQGNVTVRHTGPFENNSFTSPVAYVPVGDFTRVDANLSYGYRTRMVQGALTVYGQNLANNQYQTVNGFPDTGRTCGIRLENRF